MTNIGFHLRTKALDQNTQTEKPLTAEELDIIRRLRENEVPDPNFDPYEIFFKDDKPEAMPLSGAPEPKRRWVPSKWEKQKVCCDLVLTFMYATCTVHRS